MLQERSHPAHRYAPQPLEALPDPAPAGDTGPALPNVLLVDGDPISRRVLAGQLVERRQVKLVGAVDSRLPVSEYPVSHPDLVVLVAGPLENHVLKAQNIAQSGSKVLLVGVDWTKHRLDAALASGVTGCVSKDWSLTHLSQATSAAASGHVVLSPDLVALCVSMKPMAGGGSRLESSLQCLTSRECEVLTLLAEGMSTSEVSSTLVVSPATVKSHVSHALTKLRVRNRLEAVLLMQAALGYGIQHSER
jgi:two-component system, NarL family, nitrate/nitrite response regulator NarL